MNNIVNNKHKLTEPLSLFTNQSINQSINHTNQTEPTVKTRSIMRAYITLIAVVGVIFVGQVSAGVFPYPYAPGATVRGWLEQDAYGPKEVEILLSKTIEPAAKVCEDITFEQVLTTTKYDDDEDLSACSVESLKKRNELCEQLKVEDTICRNVRVWCRYSLNILVSHCVMNIQEASKIIKDDKFLPALKEASSVERLDLSNMLKLHSENFIRSTSSERFIKEYVVKPVKGEARRAINSAWKVIRRRERSLGKKSSRM
jgi:hypothetical protein